jgi:hypothetical protein
MARGPSATQRKPEWSDVHFLRSPTHQGIAPPWPGGRRNASTKGRCRGNFEFSRGDFGFPPVARRLRAAAQAQQTQADRLRYAACERAVFVGPDGVVGVIDHTIPVEIARQFEGHRAGGIQAAQVANQATAAGCTDGAKTIIVREGLAPGEELERLPSQGTGVARPQVIRRDTGRKMLSRPGEPLNFGTRSLRRDK